MSKFLLKIPRHANKEEGVEPDLGLIRKANLQGSHYIFLYFLTMYWNFVAMSPELGFGVRFT